MSHQDGWRERDTLNPPFRKTDSGVRPMFLQYATIVSASSIACSTSRPLKGPRFEFGTGSEHFFPSALTLATGCGAVVGDASSPSDPSESIEGFCAGGLLFARRRRVHANSSPKPPEPSESAERILVGRLPFTRRR